MLDSVYAGLQCSDVSSVRQISPVEKEMFGCAMRVVNFIVGGCKGYVAGMESVRCQRPSVIYLLSVLRLRTRWGLVGVDGPW